MSDFFKKWSDRRLERLEKEWKEAVKEKDERYAALVDYEIRREHKKRAKKGWF